MGEPEPAGTEPAPEPQRSAALGTGPDEPTVGTGSAVAIGCVVATVLIMAVGILLVLWLR